jgi:hypothetical protein
MAFDVAADGMIKVNPLVSYECAAAYEMGCLLRLVLARPEDQPGTGSLVVQMAMSVVQAEALVEDVKKTVEKIRGSRPQGQAH